MVHFLISYDLRKQRNYPTLYGVLAKLKAVKILESVWLLSINDGAIGVRDAIAKFGGLDKDDGIVVIEIKPNSDWATTNALRPGIQWLQRNIHQ